MAQVHHLLWVARSGPDGHSWRAHRETSSAGRPIRYQANIELVAAEPGESNPRPFISRLLVSDRLGRQTTHRLPDAVDLEAAKDQLETKVEAMAKASYHI